MPGAPNKYNGTENYGLTAREVELIIKAMITMVGNGVKPDFEKLANMTAYKNANAAARNWWFTEQKLKAAGSKIDGEASGEKKAGGETGGDKAGGKKRSKRQAADVPAAPPAKRGRVRKTDDDEEEQESGVNTAA